MLKIDTLHQYYGGSHILRGLSFEAKVGEVTCLLGRNGVGKTTLLRCLMGLVPARDGSIEWEGKPITSLKPQQRSRPVSPMYPRAAKFSHALPSRKTC